MSAFAVAPIRPLPVSIVAVIWLYLGSAWLVLAAVMALVLAQLVGVAQGEYGWLGVVPLFVAGTGVAGGLGLYGALQLLRLRARGRQLLQWANWLTFAGFVLFTLHVCSVFGSVPSYFGTMTFFDPSRVVLPFLVGISSSLPFALMARSLSSEEVRFAVRDAEMRPPELY